MSDLQIQRVNQVFKKIQSLHSTIQEEKQQSKSSILNSLQLQEDKLNLIEQYSNEGFDYLQKFDNKIKVALDEQRRNNEIMGQNFQFQLEQVEKNCQKLVQKWISDTQIQNQEKFELIQTQLELIVAEAEEIEKQSLQNQKYFFSKVFDEILPSINSQLDIELVELEHLDKEFDAQINRQFGGIKKELEIMKQNREGFQQHLDNLIKNLNLSFMGKIDELRKERINKQDNMLKLIENIVSKIKQDLIDSDDDD